MNFKILLLICWGSLHALSYEKLSIASARTVANGATGVYCTANSQIINWNQSIPKLKRLESGNVYFSELAADFYTCWVRSNTAELEKFSVLLTIEEKPKFIAPFFGDVFNEISEIKWVGDYRTANWLLQLSKASASDGVIWKAYTSEYYYSWPNQNGSLSSDMPPLESGESYFFTLCPYYKEIDEIDATHCAQKKFRFKGQKDSLALKIIEPLELNNTDALTAIKWNSVDSAANYYVRLSKKSDQQFESFWQKSLTDTSFFVDLRSLITKGEYRLEVLYEKNDEYHLLDTKEYVLQYSEVLISLAQQNQNIDFLIRSLQEGGEELFKDSIRVPIGEYRIEVANQNYIGESLTINISQDTNLVINITPKLSGVIGKIVGSQMQPLKNYPLTVSSSAKRFLVNTNSNGEFYFPLENGIYSLSGQKLQVNLNIQDTLLDLGTQQIDVQTFSLTGQVTSGTKNLSKALVSFKPQGSVDHIQTRTNNLGEYKVQLLEGSYSLTTDKPGFETKSTSISLHKDSYVNISLLASAKKLEGKVYRRSFLTSDTNGVMEFIPYAKVMAVNGTDTIVRYADALGFYSFNLRASLTWKLGALDQERETWVEGPNFDRPLNLVIEDYAGVFGIVNTDAPRGDLLGLMVKSDGEPIGKANFISAPTGTLGYYFPHIPTGDYKIFIAATGKVSNTTPELKVQRNIKYDRNISFAADTITLVDSTSIFNFVITGSQSIQGDVEVLFPEQKIVSLGGSATMAASDLVVFNVYPKESKYLPLLNKFWLKGQALDIKWEFSHTNSTIHTLQSPEDSLSLFLNITEDVDSAFIYYKIEEGLYKKVKHASFSGKLDFKIGGFTASSKNIEYYFEVHRGQDFYANTNRVYSSTIQYPASYIRLLHQYGDTLYVPQSKDVDVYVSAFKGNWEPADLPLASVWNLKSGIGSVTPDSLGIGAKCNLVEDGVLQILIPGQNDSLMIPFKVGKFNPHVVDLFVTKNKVYPGETIEVELMGLDTVQNLKFPLQGEITVEPPHAAKVLGTSLILDSLYPSTLFLNGRYLQNIVSTSVQVQIPIEKDAPRKVYQIDSTLSLFLPESLLLERDFVLLELRQDSIVSPALFEKQWNLKHQPFTLQFPLGGTLNKAPQFYWSENDTNQVRLYNQKTQVVTTFSEPLVTARIFGSDFGWTNDTLHLTQFYPWYYLLEEKESELKTELSILPNPFSPEIIAYNDGNDDFGTKISFFVDSPGQQKVLVDLKIYNMRGEKVRSLLKLESFSKGEYAEYWDGLTDQKRYARNGRYIVYLKSYKPGTKSTLQEVWKYVVLFK